MDSIKKVNKICKAIRTLTKEDFNAVLKMAKEQYGYIHPLKMATALRLNNTGDYNIKVIEALKKLKSVIDNKDKKVSN